jgi:hypothetical protein
MFCTISCMLFGVPESLLTLWERHDDFVRRPMRATVRNALVYANRRKLSKANEVREIRLAEPLMVYHSASSPSCFHLRMLVLHARSCKISTRSPDVVTSKGFLLLRAQYLPFIADGQRP